MKAKRILVVGGGFSGMSAAIELRKAGCEVDLVEIDAGWRSYGAGISLGGATLRAFRQLGMLDEFIAHGSAADGVSLRLPHGPEIAQLPTPRIAGADVPGGGAIMRPVLARILADATRRSGTNVRLGCTFKSIDQDGDGVEMSFTDGTRGRYDLVIGADGLYSNLRNAIFPDAPKPRYSGQGVWRAVVPRPAGFPGTAIWIEVALYCGPRSSRASSMESWEPYQSAPWSPIRRAPSSSTPSTISWFISRHLGWTAKSREMNSRTESTASLAG